MVRRVYCAAGIAVIAPHAANVVAQFDDAIGDSQPLQAHAHGNATGACANDERVETRQRLRVCGRLNIATHETHLFAHHADVFGRYALAHTHAHHQRHQFVVGLANHGCIESMRGGSSADFVGDVLRKAGHLICHDAGIAAGQVGSLKPAAIASEMHETHQQNAQVALCEGFVWGVVHRCFTTARVTTNITPP